MMPAAVAGQVLALTPIGGFLLSTLIFGGAVTGDVVSATATTRTPPASATSIASGWNSGEARAACRS